MTDVFPYICNRAYRCSFHLVLVHQTIDNHALDGHVFLNHVLRRQVGPYKTKKAGGSGAADEWSDWTFSFSLLHTPLGEFLGEARRLREVALRVKERGHG